MQNFVTSDDQLEVTAPIGGYNGGGLAKVGSLVGVPYGDYAEGQKAVIALRGIFSGLPKATGTAWTTGDKLYYDATAGNLTKTSSGNTYAGYAAFDAASGDTTGTVLLAH